MWGRLDWWVWMGRLGGGLVGRWDVDGLNDHSWPNVETVRR